jgi:anti-anti-sigma factor
MQISRRSSDDWTEMVIEGRLDGYWAEHLDTGLAEAVRDGHHRLRLDLAGVAFLSSAGIAVLVKYYKRLSAIQGALVIGSVSPQVRSVLNMTRLTSLLFSEGGATAAQTLTVGAAYVSHGVVCQMFDVHADGRMRCRAVGHDAAIGGSSDAGPARLHCPESTVAIGLGSFDAESGPAAFGEFLAVAGVAACVPADGTESADYLVASEAHAPELRASRYLACDGTFARHFRFDTATPNAPVPLSRLAAVALEFAGSPAAALVTVAETVGLVGASLKHATAPGEDLFAFPNVRRHVSFTAERAFAQSVVLVVGVVQQAEGGPVPASAIRPLETDGSPCGHFHAAAFPFRAFKKGRLSLADTVRGLFEERGIQGVLHLLRDDRPIAGVGESEFLRGACWVAPLEG